MPNKINSILVLGNGVSATGYIADYIDPSNLMRSMDAEAIMAELVNTQTAEERELTEDQIGSWVNGKLVTEITLADCETYSRG